MPVLLPLIMSLSLNKTAYSSLKQAADACKVTLATCVSVSHLEDAEYVKLVTSEFNGIEPENEMKFESTQPARTQFSFENADKEVKLALDNKIPIRGHCLVWHNQVSPWVRDGKFSADEMKGIMKDHIFGLLTHFKGKVKSWDVVNEAFTDAKQSKLRSSLWFDKPGIGVGSGYDYIGQAFKWAHEADPKAKLYYNDYNIETLNDKAQKVYEMLADFKKHKIPVTGVGFQCHLAPEYANEGFMEQLRQNIRRFRALGLEVQLTEIDVKIKSNSEEDLNKQAEIYGTIVKLALEEGVHYIQLWGVVDQYSWVHRPAQGSGWPLLFDESYKKKPAYDAVMNALTNSIRN